MPASVSISCGSWKHNRLFSCTPSQIPIIPESHQPELLPVQPPSLSPKLSPAPLSSVHYQCSPVTPPTLTCLNVSQTFAPPHSPYSLGFYSVAQSLLSLHSLAIHFLTLSPDPLIPHPTKFCPLLEHNLSPNLLPLKFYKKGGKKKSWVSHLFCPNSMPPSSSSSSSPLSSLPYLFHRLTVTISSTLLLSCLLMQWLSSLPPAAKSGEPV